MMDAESNHAKNIRVLQKQIEKLTMDLEEFDLQQDEKIELMCEKIDDVDLKLNEIRSELRASRNGKLIWKIPDVEAATKRAINEEEIALFSDIIYTGNYGYRLRGIAYLNGIASGKGTHFSLYVTIEKGEYDALLDWPFKQKVHLTLLDQNDDSSKRVHRSEELAGDRTSTSFIRPKNDTNPGWGFPRFILLEKLNSETYVKDNCIFIKIEVEPFDVSD